MVNMDTVISIQILLLDVFSNINHMAAEDIEELYRQLQELLEAKKRKGI